MISSLQRSLKNNFQRRRQNGNRKVLSFSSLACLLMIWIRIIFELIKGEMAYVKDLENIMNVYLNFHFLLPHDTHIWFRFTSSLFEMRTPPLSLETDLTISVMKFFIITMNCLHITRNLWTICMKFNESSILTFAASPPPFLTQHLISEMRIWSTFRTTPLLLIGLTMRWRIVRLLRILLMFVVNFSSIDVFTNQLSVAFSNALSIQMHIV